MVKVTKEVYKMPGIGKPAPTPPKKMGKRLPSHFGWFDNAGGKPAHEPGFGVPCPHCGKAVGRHSADSPIKTVSLMGLGSNRSYFYRVHKSCREAATDSDICEIDSVVIDRFSVN